MTSGVGGRQVAMVAGPTRNGVMSTAVVPAKAGIQLARYAGR